MASTNITTFPGKVGISNANPTHTLAIGSNVYVDDTGSNKLVVLGSISTTGTLSGDGSGISNIQSSNVNDFASNVSRITNLEASNVDVWSNLTSNATRITNLEASNVDVWSNLTSNATRITNLEASNVDVWSNLTSNATRITNLEASNVDVWSNLTSNATRITNLEASNVDVWSNLTSNATRITNLEASNVDVWSNLTSNATRITNLEASNVDVWSNLTSNATRITNLEASNVDVWSNLTSNATRVTSLESDNMTISGIKTFEDDIILESNLRVNGSLTYANTVNMIVSDPIIELGANNQHTNDLGLVLTRHGNLGNDSNVAIFYDESQDTLKIGYTDNSASETTLTTTATGLDVSITGNVAAAYDTDETSYFGRAAVGYMGQSDQASFSHLDKNTSANFALKQAASGATHLNTPTGQHIRFSVNATEVGRFTGGGDFEVGTSASTKKLIVDTSASEVQMYSQATGSTAGPDLVLMRNNPNNGANNEYIGQIRYEGLNDNGNSLLYAKTTGKIKTATNGSEDGVIETMIKTGGSNRISVRHSGAKFLIQKGTDLQVGEVANLYVDTSTSRVGIGMSNPSYTLDVDGDINLSTGSTLKINGTDAVFSNWTANGSDIYRSSGNVGIGENLTVEGDLEFNGNLTMNTITVQTLFTLDHVVSQGNTTSNTAQFTNPTTSLTTTGNVEVGGELSVSGNVEVGTANLFVDTTTGNVGVGVTEPTESLDIVGNLNLQKVSNAASIKLNSNVVTEYTRSKKLIKYPRVAMTVATTSGYTVSASGNFSGYNPWEVFDNNNPVGGNTGAGDGWASPIDASNKHYNPATGAFNLTTQHHTGSLQGEWIQIQIPEPIYLHDFVLESRSETSYGADGYDHGYPKTCELYASTDGSTWTSIRGFTTGQKTSSQQHIEQVNAVVAYKYYALVINSIQIVNNTTQVHWTSVGQIELHGIPEYDPEAHGTNVIMRSVPNVPNTDWLEVYYDGQDYTSMPSTVTDKSGNSVNGTPTGVTFDSTWKAFVFDEADDYITFSPGKSGNYVFSASIWFKSTGSSIDTLFTLNGDNTTNQAAWLYGYGNFLKFDFSNNSYDCATGRSISDGQWHHVSCTYNGDGSVSGRDIYLDGIRLSGVLGGTSAGGTLNLTSSTSAQIGAYNHPSLGYIHEFKGSIANFRLFNRALSADEVWQLYAYQKEYFDVSPDVVTFKGGRLGIGTSEPRAVLDVQGSAAIDGIVGTSPTGGIIIPSGTTAQQPTGQVGMVRFNTSSSTLEMYNGANWISIGGVSATGGTVTNVSGYTIHTFTTSGTFQVYSSGDLELLIVGGGGSGGGGRHTGGGGAGAVIHAINEVLSPGTYTITVGDGGAGAGGNALPGKGNDSLIEENGTTLYEAQGGGAGGIHPSSAPGIKYEYGQDGGCGGGGGHNATSGVSTAGFSRLGLGLTNTPAFGGNGAPVINRAACGGGGGAGANGSTGSGGEDDQAGNGGNGGDGYQTSISGTSLYWAGGGGGSASPNSQRNSTSAQWIGGSGGNGGGGGGATGVRSDASGSSGGSGGTGLNSGADGSFTTTNNACHGGSAGVNTGGGGGGAGGWSSNGNGNGGNGGSGIVIIRYLS